MTELQTQTAPPAQPALEVTPGPHFGTTGRSTRWMMLDVVLGLVPAVAMAFYVFGSSAGRVLAVSIVACMATESLFRLLRGQSVCLKDGSALVTGLILGLSLPWTAPWWIVVIGSVAAMGIGKMAFGGLGQNIFNPAMVGRAFLMICFAQPMTMFLTAEKVSPPHAYSAATPLTNAKTGDEQGVKAAQPFENLFLGNVNGSLGETSALALLIGGIYLCVRRSAAWQIPAGALFAALAVSLIQHLVSPGLLGPHQQLAGGALLFGALFIATDPVSSPISAKGRFIFGLGFGALTMILRLVSSYPEGVMFAVLLMNSVTPMINRWTIPRPVGGPLPKPAAT